MATLPQTWTFGNFQFHLVHDDIFEVPVDSIVSSNQTDFYPYQTPGTVCGEICRRYPSIPEELLSYTESEALPKGTVLTTSGAGDYTSIYHIGYHHPGEWQDTSESDESEYVQIIANGIQEVLTDFFRSDLQSIAFPLIGCGLFNLDEELLTYEFMQTLIHFAQLNTTSAHPRDVWLVVYHDDDAGPVLNAVVQALIDMSSVTPQWEPLRLGISHLDEFEANATRTTSPKWGAWTLARHTELIIHFAFSYLAARQKPVLSPESVISEGQLTSFGMLRHQAQQRALEINKEHVHDPWVRFLAERFVEDVESEEYLLQINQDRNDIAHGRAFRSASAMREDLKTFLGLSEWRRLYDQHKPSPTTDLTPWLRISDNNGTGILERWQATSWRYLIPSSGITFRTPR